MGAQHLRSLFVSQTPRENGEWYCKKIAIARAIVGNYKLRVSMFTVVNSLPASLPEAEEIVNTTIMRIMDVHNERYHWDRTIDFDRFFSRCLYTTLNSLISKERSHLLNPQQHRNEMKDALNQHNNINDKTSERVRDDTFSLVQDLKPDDELSRKQAAPVLAAMIADNTRISGKGRDYANNIYRYAAEQYSADEIAEDLAVKKSTVFSIRKRVTAALSKPKNSDGRN